MVIIDYVSADFIKVTISDVKAHFESHIRGVEVQVQLCNGYAFVEYLDASDARDVANSKYPLYLTSSVRPQVLIAG